MVQQFQITAIYLFVILVEIGMKLSPVMAVVSQWIGTIQTERLCHSFLGGTRVLESYLQYFMQENTE